ncbi:MAG: hypothetical protein J0L89_08420 [Xanthomonadales bacterium]|nr:hypothetical protein [Xanthomonadales bacterium]
MTTKKPTKNAPAEAGAANWVTPPTLVSDARPGNRKALARAYGVAAAGIRAGYTPPSELAQWLADRLNSLALVLADKHDKKMEGVHRALNLVEAGKPGRKPANQLEEAQRRGMVYDVAYQRTRGGTLQDAYDRVVKLHEAAGHYITVVQVEAAWKARRKLIPEMDS